MRPLFSRRTPHRQKFYRWPVVYSPPFRTFGACVRTWFSVVDSNHDDTPIKHASYHWMNREQKLFTTCVRQKPVVPFLALAPVFENFLLGPMAAITVVRVRVIVLTAITI
jgi:hypothetical protein